MKIIVRFYKKIVDNWTYVCSKQLKTTDLPNVYRTADQENWQARIFNAESFDKLEVYTPCKLSKKLSQKQ